MFSPAFSRQRFTIDDSGDVVRIRANQGHSIKAVEDAGLLTPVASAAEVHAQRIKQRADEAKRVPGSGEVPMSPRSRLESFRAEQNLRQQGTGDAEAAAAL